MYLNRNLLMFVSQFVPVYPSSHVQTYEFAPVSWHIPEFWHGLGEQSSGIEQTKIKNQ